MQNSTIDTKMPVDWATGDPIFLFGNFRLYPFTMLLGIIASILSIIYFWKKNRFAIDILLTLIIITIPSAIVGARLFWIIETAINKEDLSRWYAIWDGGLSIQGGVILPMVFDLLYLRRKRNVIDVRKVFGIIIPNILLGQQLVDEEILLTTNYMELLSIIMPLVD